MNISEIFSLAVQNQKKNNYQVAKDLYNQTIKINPNLVEAYNNLGFIFNLEGQNEKAKECYEKAIKIKPNFKQINNKEPNFMNYENKWEKIEKIEDDKEILKQKKFVDTLSGLSISDFLIMNHWLNYAKLIDDLSYKDLSTNFIYSDYVVKKMSNQLEFRSKEFL